MDNAEVTGSPEKPCGLTKVQEEFWEAIVNHLPDGAVGYIDTVPLRELVRWYGVYADLMSMLEQDPTDQGTLRSAKMAWDTVYRLAGDFGLTPAARAKLMIPKGQSKPVAGALAELIESRN